MGKGLHVGVADIGLSLDQWIGKQKPEDFTVETRRFGPRHGFRVTHVPTGEVAEWDATDPNIARRRVMRELRERLQNRK
jgi:hypothetical protein